MTAPCDVVVIGAGHNGLVCACYLARAGLRVRVLERRHVVGGAAVTEEFHPGFRNSTASYTVSLLNPKVIGDLRLAEHGLRVVERPIANFLPLPDGRSFAYGGGMDTTQRELSAFSARDAARLPEYLERIERIADVLRAVVLQTPPNVGGGLSDVLRAIALGGDLRRLDMPARRDLLELFARSAGEMLDDWFESDPIKAVLGWDAVVGNFASPYAPGSAYVQLHHAFGETNGKRGVWGHAIGGMGAITQAMAKEAAACGVEVRLSAPVAKVLASGGRARGVVLESGEEIPAQAVAANVGPKLLYLRLVDAQELDTDFRERMMRFKAGSGTLRMNVALAELPDFVARPGKHAQPHHGAGIILGPSLAYFDRTYTDAKALGWSRQPIVEVLVPTTLDDTLAPPGMHVASLFCQHFAPHLPAGRSWDAERDAAAQAVIDVVDAFAPNFRRSILGMKILSPLDLERELGLVDGDIFHGRLSLEQLFSARPVLGYGDYRSPIRGLYLCGSGAHPGGGVTGAPGHNAAREIVRDWKRGKLR
jgi:phytoene dehydrogenase-like protein